MSNFEKAKKDVVALVDFLERCEKDYEKGKLKLNVSGELQREAAQQPGELGYYDELRAELKALRNYYDQKAKRIRGKLYREYLENYARALQKQDIEQYINADKRWQSADDLYQEVALIYEKYESLIEAFRSKGWMISHIIKLRTAGLEDALI